MSDRNDGNKTTTRTSGLMRAIRLAAFLARNPLADARATVAACVAQETARASIRP